MGLWAMLFPPAKRRRSPGWNNANPIADIGQSWGKGNGPRRRGGGRGASGGNRCNRCPSLQSQIERLKERNKRLRDEIERLKRKQKGNERGEGRDRVWRQGVHEIAQLTWKQQRLIFTMPEIRAVCERLLGMKEGGSTRKYAPKRYR